MKRKVRIFVYALVAWFVGLAVIAYDFAVVCASDFVFSGLYWYQAGEEVGRLHDHQNVVNDRCDLNLSDAFSSRSDCIVSGAYYVRESNSNGAVTGGEVCTCASLSEVVAVAQCSLSDDECTYFGINKNYKEKKLLFMLLSNSVFDYVKGNVSVSKDSDGNVIGLAQSDSSYGILHASKCQGNENLFITTLLSYSDNVKFGFGAKMKVFSSLQDAVSYLETGTINNLLFDGSVPQREYDGENIYLNDFQMIVHDSNAYSAYYLEFKYTIPEQLRDAASLKLDIAESFEWCIGLVANTARIPKTFSGTNYIDILQNPTGFKLYLKDIDAITDLVGNSTLSNLTRRAVLGSNMGPIDLSALTIDGLGGETLGKVTNSKLYLTCYVVANNKYGVNYSGSVDFLSGLNDMSSYTPDSSGNYKYNGDLKDQGHYFTDVSTDAAGNTTYNYYYYGTDNSKTEITAKDSSDNTISSGGSVGSIINNITMPDHVFVTVSGSAGGGSSGGGSSGGDVGDVTIEDDDLSFNSLRDSIKDGYGLIDDTDTGAKGDGLIAMLSDLFGYLPAKFVGLIMLGTSSVVGIAILRMIFKR